MLIGVLLQSTIVRTIVRAKENLKLRLSGPSYSQKVSEPAKGHTFFLIKSLQLFVLVTINQCVYLNWPSGINWQSSAQFDDQATGACKA